MSIAAIPSGRETLPALQEDLQKLQGRSPASFFVTRDGTPTSALVTLLKACGLFAEGDHLAQIVEKTQKAWIIAHSGGCRRRKCLGFQHATLEERAAIVRGVDEFISTSGFYGERKNALRNYTYAICNGAFLDGVRKNIIDIINLWDKGVNFSSLVFVTGDRPLRKDPDGYGREREDAVRKLEDFRSYPFFKIGWRKPADARYETEYDMVKLVWDQTEIVEDMAEELEGRVSFINAPAEAMGTSGTKDPFREWLKSSPEPGTVIVIASDRPGLWPYSQLAGETALSSKGFGLDTVANAVSRQGLKVYYAEGLAFGALDTFAKCLYEIQEARKVCDRC